jgi:hypothetical protein
MLQVGRDLVLELLVVHHVSASGEQQAGADRTGQAEEHSEAAPELLAGG